MIATSLSALLAATLTAASAVHGPNSGSHRAIANNLSRDNKTHVHGKRYTGQATWFDVGLGACGKWSQPSDFIVALDTPLYGYGSPGPQCFKSVVIHGEGTCSVAVIMDECPSCAEGSLDMSKGLFESFTNLGVGEFPISWEYGSSCDGGQPPATTHHTTHHTTSTTTTQIPTTTTTTQAATTTSDTSSGDTSSQSSTTSSSAASSTTSGTGDGDGDGSGGVTGNIALQQQVVANMGFMISLPRV